jgi:HEAT repeat protein
MARVITFLQTSSSLSFWRNASLLVCGFVVALFVLSGCGEERTAAFDTSGDKHQDDERVVMLATIKKLAAGKDLSKADNVVVYHKAIDDLIARGSTIETAICEALASDEDWGVRVGAVEVLKGIGTRASIETLLGALEDPQPLVGLNANYLLRELTKHSVIPTAGSPAANGLPPVPVRAVDDLALDAEEKLWASWYDQHKVTLHKVWREWWTANKAAVAIQ